MAKGKWWMTGVAAAVSGWGLAVGVVAAGGVANAAQVSHVSRSSAMASPMVPVHESVSLSSRIEDADQLALKAAGGGRVVAVQKVNASGTNWLVTVQSGTSTYNVLVNEATGVVINMAPGVAAQTAIR